MRAIKRIALALLAAPALLGAQEPQPTTPAGKGKAREELNLLLSSALRRVKIADELVARVAVKQEEKELAGPGLRGAGGFGGVVVNLGGRGTGRPFEGAVEAWRGRDGALVILSEREFPGFGLLLDGDRVIKQVTYEEESYAFEPLQAELGALMDPSRLTRQLLDAKLAPRRATEGGDIVFEGPVDKSIVHPLSSGVANPFLRKRVLRAEAEIVLAADGRLKTVRVKVVHSDPVRAMMQRGLRRVRIQLGAGGVPVPTEKGGGAEKEKHDVETGSTTYTLAFHRSGPSERARRFKERMKELAENQK